MSMELVLSRLGIWGKSKTGTMVEPRMPSSLKYPWVRGKRGLLIVGQMGILVIWKTGEIGE